MAKAAKRQRTLDTLQEDLGLDDAALGYLDNSASDAEDFGDIGDILEDRRGTLQHNADDDSKAEEAPARRPVWSDNDAAAAAVSIGDNAFGQHEASQRKKCAALHPRTQWAKRPPGSGRAPSAAAAAAAGLGDGEEGDADGGAGLALLASQRRLPAGQVEVTRLKDANQHRPSDAVVQAVRFHPNGQVLLTAGMDKKLRLFQVDGVQNTLLQEIYLEDMPVLDAAFGLAAGGGGGGAGSAGAGAGASAAGNGSVSGVEAEECLIAVGRRPFAYLHSLASGRTERLVAPRSANAKSLELFAVSPRSTQAFGGDPLVAFGADGGCMPLLSLRSRQWVGSLKMSGSVRALTFSHDGRDLYSIGDKGSVHIWDLRTRRCRLAFADCGNAGDATSLALSADGRYLATGSRMGIVNVYSGADVEAAAARAASGAVAGGGAACPAVAPLREVTNLTTSVDTLRFSPDSQMLAIASRMHRDSLRLVHLPSLTTFANWPTSRSPLGHVHCLDFSPRCGLLAIGNAKGRALLYRLHHYQQA